MRFKRIFLVVLDSLGVGETADTVNFGDNGANTLGHVNEKCDLFMFGLRVGNYLPFRSRPSSGWRKNG